MSRFFVSADTGPSYGMLLGPYATKALAEAKVDLGNKLANAACADAAFWGFGVTEVRDPDMQVDVAFCEDGTRLGKGRAYKKTLGY